MEMGSRTICRKLSPSRPVNNRQKTGVGAGANFRRGVSTA